MHALTHHAACIGGCIDPRVCDMHRRQHERLTTLRARRAAAFFSESQRARDDVLDLARYGRLLDWHDGIAIYTRDNVRTVIRVRDSRVLQVIRR